MRTAHFLTTLALLALSAGAGTLANLAGLPLPYMLGPLIVSGAVATALPHRLPDGYTFPQWLRMLFITVIGLMIGAQVTPALFAALPRLALSLAALTLFVLLAHALNYMIFRRLGGYDRATAFYSASPGGLFESIAMGEEAGADLRRLMLQQFLRIIVVVTTLPIGLSLWMGHPVGRAGGMSLAREAVPWQDLPLIIAAGLAGQVLGRALHLPAAQLIGPMAAAATLSLTGWMQIAVPQWLVNDAQIVVGTALGMRFAGINRALILRGAGLALLSVALMLVLAAGFATLLTGPTGLGFDVLLVSFAPGGVTEMALVALSLQANPALVTLHHIFRILVTVLGLSLTARPLRRFL